MMKLFFLWFVMQMFGYLARGEVVQSFKDSCPQFFIADPSDQNVHYPPTVLHDSQRPERYQQICQRYNNIYRYATLYDTKNRIPVYSSYSYIGYHKVDKAEWKIEPQLDDPSLGPNMERENTVQTDKKGKNQALYDDYASHSQEYTRGHLYPRCHNNDQQCAIATYTHTNAVPQTQQDNNYWAHKVEKKMEDIISNSCDKGFGHVVTGAVPGNSWMGITRDKVPIKEGVNIPANFWTAYCCTDKNTQTLASGAWLARRDPKGLVVRKMTVGQLEDDLTHLYGNSEEAFMMFGRLCQGSKLSRFYYALTNFFLDIFTS